jgi:predicted nucleotide-binding protein (sugar kinase/HSP70/actin superfamily)
VTHAHQVDGDTAPAGSSARTIPIHAAPATSTRRAAPVASPRAASGGDYRAYRPGPYTPADRGQVTVLIGNLHWRVERLMQGVLENLGHRSERIPTATLGDLKTGREVADIGQCCPTSFTTGNLVNFLRARTAEQGAEAVARNYVYLTAGSCGSCRFGQYHQSYELALRQIGLEHFRLYLMGQGNLDQGGVPGGGLDLGMPASLGAVWSIMLSDVVQDLEYRIRPYERQAGATAAAAEAAIAELHQLMRERPRRGQQAGLGGALWHLSTPYFADAMRRVRRHFDGIELDRLQAKPIVKLTGEFYLQTAEGDPNHHIHRWLEAEGAEVYPAAITGWLDYLMRVALQGQQDRVGIQRGARGRALMLQAAQGLLRWTYNRLRHALGDVPHELPHQEELRRLAAPHFHSRLRGGEGDMLVGKALWSHLHHKAHMICELSPYGCMPNTMSIGAMAGVTGRYPDLLYAPIEIKGDAEVHALSRCQMILTEARQRARREYDTVLARIGLTEDELRAVAAAHPALNRATTPIPQSKGVVGSAANFALHLAAVRSGHKGRA